MVDTLDFIPCPVCGTFYTPETLPVEHGLSPGQLVELKWLEREVYVDFAAIEWRVFERYRLTGVVVDPPLTGRFLDVEV